MSVAVSNCHSAFGGPSAKGGSSAKLCVLVFKASLLYYGGSIFQSVCLPSVMYWHSRHLCCIGGSIGQSRFICQVLCTGIQGIYALFVWGVHQPKKVCLPSTSLASRWGVHWPKKVHLPSTSLAIRWGVHWSKKVHLPIMNTLLNLLLLHRGLFYERQKRAENLKDNCFLIWSRLNYS